MDDDTSSEAASLDEEQLAFFKARMESGFYRSPAVIKHVAERLTGELRPEKNA